MAGTIVFIDHDQGSVWRGCKGSSPFGLLGMVAGGGEEGRKLGGEWDWMKVGYT